MPLIQNFHRQSVGWRVLPHALLLLAIWCDGVSTYLALNTNPNAYESNPIAAWAFARVGVVPSVLLLLAVTAVVGLPLYARNPRRMTVLLLCAIFTYSVAIRVPVIISNIHIAVS